MSDIAQLSIDVKAILEQLRSVATAWQGVREQFKKQLTFTIDDKSIKAMGKSVATALKEAGVVATSTAKKVEDANVKAAKTVETVVKKTTKAVKDGEKEKQDSIKKTAAVAEESAKKVGNTRRLTIGGQNIDVDLEKLKKLENRYEAMRKKFATGARMGLDMKMPKFEDILRIGPKGAAIDDGSDGAWTKHTQAIESAIAAQRKLKTEADKAVADAKKEASEKRKEGKEVEALTAAYLRLSAAMKKLRNPEGNAEVARILREQGLLKGRDPVSHRTEDPLSLLAKGPEGLRSKFGGTNQELVARIKIVTDAIGDQIRANLSADKQDDDTKKKQLSRIDRVTNRLKGLQAQIDKLDNSRGFRLPSVEAFDKLSETGKGDLQRKINDLKHLDKQVAQAERAVQGLTRAFNKLSDDQKQKAPSGWNNPQTYLDPNGRFDKNSSAAMASQMSALGAKTTPVAKVTKELAKDHQVIGSAMARNIAYAAKWYLLYSGVREVMQAISSAARTLVRSGLEYTTQAELQKIALQGILAENFTIVDAQNQQLTGMTAITRMGAESEKQWAQIQSSALAVVGTTSDLMVLYSGVLPFASRLGVEADRTQRFVKSAAVAASLLDISFQDARSALVSMLQGRVLTRNRLTTVLGVQKSDLDALKGTVGLFELLESKLDNFGLLADQAQQSFGAMKEQARDVAGIIGREFVAPFVKLFQNILGGLSKPGSIMGSLFEEDADQLKVRKEILAYFQVLKTTIAESTAPIQEFWDAMRGGGRESFKGLTTGLKEVLTAVSEILVFGAKLTMWITQFIGTLGPVLPAIKAIVLVLAGGGGLTWALKSVGTFLFAIVPGLKAWVAGLAAARTATVAASAATTAMTAATATATVTVSTFATVLTGGVALALGGLVYWLTQGAIKKKEFDEVMRMSSYGQASKAFGKVNFSSDAAEEVRENQPQSRALMEGFAKDIEVAGKSDKHLSGLTIDTVAITAQALINKRTALAQAIDGAKLSKDANIVEINEYKQFRAAKAAELNEVKAALDTVKTILSTQQNIASEINARTFDTAEAAGSGDTFGSFNILAGNSRTQRMASDIKAQRGMLLSYIEEMEDIDARANPMKPIPEEKSKTRQSFVPTEDEEIKAYNSLRDHMKAMRQLDLDDRLITEQQFWEETSRMATMALDYEIERRQNKIRRLKEEFLPQQLAKIDDPDEAKELKDSVARDVSQEEVALQDAFQRRTLLQRQFGSDRVASAKEVAEKLLEVEEELSQKEAALYDKEAESAAAKIEKDRNKLLRDLTGTGKYTPEQLARVKARFDALITGTKAKVGFEAEAKQVENQLEALASARDLLNQQFQSGAMSPAAFSRDQLAMNQKELDLLEKKRVILGQLLSLQAGVPGWLDTDAYQAIEAALANIDARQAALLDRSEELFRVFSTSSTLLGGIQGIVGLFDAWGTKVSEIVGALQQALSVTEQIFQVSANFREVSSSIRAMLGAGIGLGQAAGAGSAAAGAAGAAGAAVQGADGVVRASESVVVTGTGGATEGSARATQAMAGIAFGVGAAIAIAGAMFEKAVQKAKDTITKSVDAIADAMADGSIGIGEGLAQMEKTREQMIDRYSKSKSGRKALKDMLPGIEDEIKALKNRIKDIRENFEQNLRTLSLGDSPFGKMAEFLFDLEKKANEYLATFQYGTAGYTQALEKVRQMWDIAIRNYKDTLEQAADGFASEALSNVENLINAIKQGEQIDEELREIEEALTGEDGELAEQQRRIDEERQKRVEQRLALEKKIADIIRQAAQDEMDIRRRGVSEAQLSVAERKAMEISQVRNRRQEELSSASRELRDFNANDTVEDLVKELEEKRADLIRRRNELLEDQEVNRIRIENARTVVGIEGEMLNIAHTRAAVEAARGQIEARNATRRVTQWRETERLIDSIIEGGDGVMFNPPPNFPQIRVQIGTVIIDNKDQSQNSSNVTVPDPRDGGGDGGGEREGKNPRRRGTDDNPRPDPRRDGLLDTLRRRGLA